MMAGPSSQRMARPPSTEVVLCTYNGEKYLPEQLQSIIDQSRPVDRISLYDDGSTDRTLTVAEEFAARCKVRGILMSVSRNPVNLGYAQNFAQGLRLAREELVLFCDQDDVWETRKVERLAAVFASADTVMAFSDGSLIDAEGRLIGLPTVLHSYGLARHLQAGFSHRAWAALLCRNYVNGAAMMVRRAAAQSCLPIPAGFPHDYWLTLLLAAKHRIACVPEVLYRYRQHEQNTIGIGAMGLPRLLLSIWRNPMPPRQLDLRRTRLLLEHAALDDEKRQQLQEKCRWLERAVEPASRWSRFANLGQALARGYYFRFAPPYAFLRDAVVAVKGL